MKRPLKPILIALLSGSLVGCAADGSIHPAAAVAGCGATGAIVGLATRSYGWGAGAAGGCLALSWAISSYNATRVRSAQEDQKLYGYGLTEPITTSEVKIRKVSSSPVKIRPGQSVKAETTYSVMLPSNVSSVDVKEWVVLKKDGNVLTQLDPETAKREAAAWTSDVTIPIPDGAEKGTYVIEHHVVSGASNDMFESTFVVGS